MKKAGIITFHCVDDYGGMLQSYALKTFLNNIGLKAEIVNYVPYSMVGRYWWIPYVPYNSIKSCLMYTYRVAKKRFRTRSVYSERRRKMRTFREDFLRPAGPVRRSARSLDCQEYDLIFVGSDQVWNPDITFGFHHSYFGCVKKKESAKVISYAASIGKKKFRPNEEKEFEKMLLCVDKISVREASSVDYVKSFTDKDVCHMPDPTLLLTKQEWEKVTKNPGEENYILLYFTEHNEELMNQAIETAKERKLKVVSLSPVNAEKYPEIEVQYGIGPSEFLGYVHDADAFFTNSFHGMVFGMIFEKELHCFSHSSRGDRINDLLAIMGRKKEETKAQFNVEEKMDELRKQAEKFVMEQ